MSTSRRVVLRSAVSGALLSMVSVMLLAVGVPARVDQQGGRDRPTQVGSVDFVLVTATGQPVPDLRADELTLRIDNKNRPIRSLRFVKVASTLTEAGPDAIASLSRFVLHLSEKDAEDLITRIGAVLDEYTQSDRQRSDQPAYGGIFVLHRSPD